MLGFRMPPLDRSASFGAHYADLTTVLLYRSLVPMIGRGSVQQAHEIGVGMYGTLAIAVARKFPTLRLSTSTIDPAEVRSATRTARANGVELVCVCSDVLGDVEGAFDLIWWNLPYNEPGVRESVDRLCRQIHQRRALRPGGVVVLGFNTVPLPLAEVEGIVARHPHLRVERVTTFWYNPHCVLTLASR